MKKWWWLVFPLATLFWGSSCQNNHPQQTFKVKGKLLDTSGQPLTNIMVTVRPENGPELAIAKVTDKHGTFALNLRRGQYLLLVSSSHLYHTFPVDLQGKPVDTSITWIVRPDGSNP